MPRPRVPSINKVALGYLAAGRSVVPIAPASKAPSIPDSKTGRPVLIWWERYQAAGATADEVRRWFSGRYMMGLGIVAGAVSGVKLGDGTEAGLEVLDVDDPEIHGRFLDLSQVFISEPCEVCSPFLTEGAARGSARMVSFTGAHVAKEVILACGRWSLASPLSDRQVEELMPERGVAADHPPLGPEVQPPIGSGVSPPQATGVAQLADG